MEKLFNFDDFDIKLDTEFIGRNFIYCEEINSTNSYLRECENENLPSGTVLLAEYQTHGKGRRNRSWFSEKGQNLTFSILLKDKKSLPENLNFLNFIGSLAITTMLDNHYRLKTSVKWPNDVMINSKKTAGILLESVIEGSKIKKVIVGIGLNVNQTAFAANFIQTPTSMRIELKRLLKREIILAELLNSFESILLKCLQNPEHILTEWRQKCDMLGKRITISDGDLIKDGTFVDIDSNGFLLLKSKGKIETIHFGDVSIR